MEPGSQGNYHYHSVWEDITMARTQRRTADRGVSLAKGPVGIIGMILVAYGVTGLIFGDSSFSSSPLDGTVDGETWLGIEGNGWSNLLAIGAGAILMFGAQLHWGAKTTALIVGLGFAAAAIIALIDGSDVLGIFAANDATKLAWGITAAVLIVVALLPRIGRKSETDTTETADDRADRDRDRDLAATDTGTGTVPADRDPRFDRVRDRDRTDGAVSEKRAER